MSRIKKLFATPKKAILSIICAAAIVTAVCAGTVFAAGTVAESTAIGEENARNFAFADAGVDPASATVLHTEFDYEMGQFVYDVEFIADGTEYEYLIKASNGTVLKKEVEVVDALRDNSNTAAAVQEETVQETAAAVQEETVQETAAAAQEISETASTGISLEEAKSIAFADAGVTESDITLTKAKQDYDDGILVYDIEFYTAAREYEYEIHAETGAIYGKSTEAHETAAGSVSNSSGAGSSVSDAQISAEEAKNIALEHAGLSEANVTFKKAKLDRDDGITLYDIEFYYNGMEYEYEINAATGAILDFDCDWDD